MNTMVMEHAARRPHWPRLGNWLALPWYANRRKHRWLTGIAEGLGALVLIGVAIWTPAGMRGTIITITLAFMGGWLWLSYLPATVLLARHARGARLPHAIHAIHASLVLHLALTWLIPTLVATWAGLPVGKVAVTVLACYMALFLFALAPRWIATPLCLAPAAAVIFQNHVHLHLPAGLHPSNPAFVPIVGALAVLLLITAAWRYAQLTRAMPQGLWREPWILMAHRRNGHTTGRPISAAAARVLIRRRADWLQPRIRIDRTGPNQPEYSLRVGMGATWAPKQWSRSWLTALPGVAFGLLALAYLVLTLGPATGAAPHFSWHATLLVLGWVCVSIGTLVALLGGLALRTFYGRNDAGLALLALLPGVGSATASKRALVRIVLGRAARAYGVALVLGVLLLAAGHHLAAGTWWGLLAITAITALGTLAVTSANLGQVKAPLLVQLVVEIYLIVVGAATVVMVTIGNDPTAHLDTAWLVVACAWVPLTAAALAYWLRGRARWRAMPHPFLARED